MQDSENSVYTSDKEMVDSLKMEYSSLIPADQEKIVDLALDIRNLIIESYGKYMSPDTKIRFSNIEDRILVTNREGFNNFLKDWLPENDINEITKNDARLFFMGNIVCLQDMREEALDIWNRDKDIFIDNNLGKDIVVNYIQQFLVTSAMTHEFIHAAWKETFPMDMREKLATLALAECGASYTTNELLKRGAISPEIFLVPFKDERINAFGQILLKYGDNSYYVFFNHRPESIGIEEFEQLRNDILSEFDPKTLVNLGIILEDQSTLIDSIYNPGS